MRTNTVMNNSSPNQGLTHAFRSFADTLCPDAERLDLDADLLHARYLDFQRSGLHEFGGARQPLEMREAMDCLSILAEASGAFAFLALQQWVANMGYPDPVGQPWPRLGVAFGHLRNSAAPSPVWENGVANGIVPWMTGAGTFEEILLGVRMADLREAYAWVDGRDREELCYSEPMNLVSCTATRTVRIEVKSLRLEESCFTRVEEPGTLARNDAMGVLFQTPLMIGNLKASLRLIESSTVMDAPLRIRCFDTVSHLIDEVYDSLDTGTPVERGPDLRARIGDMTSRLSRLAVMACGGKALALGHPAQRVYREALLFSLMAQTERIVNDAFEAVFT
jgi:hypothetical protein